MADEQNARRTHTHRADAKYKHGSRSGVYEALNGANDKHSSVTVKQAELCDRTVCGHARSASL